MSGQKSVSSAPTREAPAVIAQPDGVATVSSSRERSRGWNWALLALVTMVAVAGSWLLFPHARKALNGWRSIQDGVAVQRSLQGDFTIDDEFARAAFAEFSRLAPEADVGQLHLHLVRPAFRAGWSSREERPWRLADLADLRPLRATSYFAQDTRISEAYADLLEQLRLELYEDAQLTRDVETIRREFTSALRATGMATRDARRASSGSATRLRESATRLATARAKLTDILGRLPKIGMVERAYLDLIGPDAQLLLMTPSGVEAPFARVELAPDFDDWIERRRLDRVGSARVRGTHKLDSEVPGQPPLVLDIDAQEIAVFRFSRAPWFRQELVSQFRQTARGSGLFGADGSLGVIPVGAVFARGLTLSIRGGAEEDWKKIVDSTNYSTLELPHSVLKFPFDEKAFKRGDNYVRVGDMQDVKLVAVICRWM